MSKQSDIVEFLSDLKGKDILNRMTEVRLLNKRQQRQIQALFVYDAYIKQGHNKTNAVYLTARKMQWNEQGVYRVLRFFDV